MNNPIPYTIAALPSKEELTAWNSEWKARYRGTRYVIESMESKYGDYLYTPLDIPKIEVPKDFIDFYYEHASFTYKRLADVASSPTPENQYGQNSTFLTIDSKPTVQGSIWTKNFVAELLTTYKSIFDQINEYLPLNSPIEEFALWSSTKTVPLHRDESSFLDLPTQFRVLLQEPSEGTDTTLRLRTHSPVNKNDNFFEVHKPKETNTFVWNNLRALHGSEFKNQNKILFIPTGFVDIDWKKYNELLERSFIKYRSFSFIDNYRKEDYIND